MVSGAIIIIIISLYYYCCYYYCTVYFRIRVCNLVDQFATFSHRKTLFAECSLLYTMLVVEPLVHLGETYIYSKAVPGVNLRYSSRMSCDDGHNISADIGLWWTWK